MAITLADFNKIWASTSPLTPYSFSESNYKQGWNFIGSTPPARQMWDFLQKNNDEKMQYLATNYLPLSGGTMTGGLTFSDFGGYNLIQRAANGKHLTVLGGNDYSKCASISLAGGEENSGTTYQGSFTIRAAKDDGTNKYLFGSHDGTLTWGGQPIQTSSDKRIKRDFSDVPDEVLEAWGKVNWQQFKYIADVERKGENCRFHTGLVAQYVKEVGEENNVDLLKYGILCHDVREAVEEEKDENGNVIREASEAVDLWTIRYEEALAMEAAYQRRRADRLEARIEALEKLLMNRTE